MHTARLTPNGAEDAPPRHRPCTAGDTSTDAHRAPHPRHHRGSSNPPAAGLTPPGPHPSSHQGVQPRAATPAPEPGRYDLDLHASHSSAVRRRADSPRGLPPQGSCSLPKRRKHRRYMKLLGLPGHAKDSPISRLREWHPHLRHQHQGPVAIKG